MQTNISSVTIKTIKTKPEENFSSKLLSREMSLNNSSSEVYYGDTSIAIPFRWESQPGTPKVKFPERPLPPLTPPPSYLCNTAKKYVKNHSKTINILRSVFPKLNQRKSQVLSSPAASWSSSSSSSSSPWSSRSVPSSPFTPRFRREEKLSTDDRLSFDSRAYEVDESPHVSTTLCFGNARSSSNDRSSGYSTRVIKLLLGESHV